MKNRAQSSEEVLDRNVKAVREYLTLWKLYLDEQSIWVIEPSSRLYDSIAFSLLNKAYRLSQACVCLVQSGFLDEAYGLSRSILECAINLRYLTLDQSEVNSRAWNFANFFRFERQHFLKLARKYIKDRNMLARIESGARIQGIEQDTGGMQARHLNDWKGMEQGKWDGFSIASKQHPLDTELNPRCDILQIYVVFYRAASAMVHCSIRAIDNNFAVSSFPFRVTEGTPTTFNHSFEPLLTIVQGLYLSAHYALYGANLDRGAKINALLDDTLSKLSYVRQAG